MKQFTALLSLAAVAAALPSTPKQFGTSNEISIPLISNETIYVPPSNYTDPGTLYARTAELADGTLLATWENYSPEPPPVYFPIYRSTDHGQTWHEFSRVEDTQQGWGLRYQPFLYVLPESIGGFDAGTVLLSGNSIPTNLSRTQIELYASRDDGETWEFVSHIAAGGEAEPDNGLTPVWEPFLLLHNGSLIAYYSDQRDNATYGQKLVHQTTTDLLSWGPVVNDVTYPTYTDRPGMPTLAQLGDGRFIYTYEYGGGPNPTTSGYSFPVYFRIAADPEAIADAEGQPVIASDGTRPVGSPYVVWTPVGGGANGTIVVSCGNRPEVFVNTQLGEGDWQVVQTPEDTSYSRSLRILEEGPSKLLLIGAGALPPSTTNRVSVSVMDIGEAVAALD